MQSNDVRPRLALRTGFGAMTPWSPVAAVVAAFAVVIAAIACAGGIGAAYFWLARHGGFAGSGSSSMTQTGAMLAMLLMQAVIVLLSVWLAGWYGGVRSRVLSTERPATVQLVLTGLAGLAALLIPYNIVIYLLWPQDFAQDLRPFFELVRSPAAGIAALVVVAGAPLSEELLFRGFLLPALVPATARFFVGLAISVLAAQMLAPLVLSSLFVGRSLPAGPAGLVFALTLVLLFVSAGAWWRMGAQPVADAAGARESGYQPDPARFALAALFTTSAWTLMHLGYSMVGLLEVFITGLYFCWLLWRFGNLWLTILLHGLYNGLQFAILMFVPLPTPA